MAEGRTFQPRKAPVTDESVYGMTYFILKGGVLQEGISETDMRDQLEEGILTRGDLVRPEDGYFWTPLGRVVPRWDWHDRVAAILQPGRDWIRLARRRPIDAGLACLALGLVFCLLSRWPVLIYGLPLLGALFIGGRLMLQQRLMAGLALCAAAIILPILVLRLAGA